MAEFLHRLLDWIGRLGILRVEEPILYWMIIIALVAALVGMLVHLVWTLQAVLRMPEPPARSIAASAALPDLAGEAETLAANGRYLEAAHRLMLASFRSLVERSVLELTPDRPNRWIRAALRGSPLAQSLVFELDSLVERTERMWFGDRENDREIYVQWRSAFERLSSAAR